MMLSILLSLILLCLGLLHYYWLFDGEWGFSQALPTKESGERVLNPSKIDTAVVGLGLTIFSAFYLLQSGLLTYQLPDWILKYAGWIIPTIFLIRAIGDFKYVGFFKAVKSTDFGKKDTKFYSPLCLIMAILGMIIQLLN